MNKLNSKRIKNVIEEILKKLISKGAVNVQLDDSPEGYHIYKLIKEGAENKAKEIKDIKNNAFSEYEYKIIEHTGHYDFDLIGCLYSVKI